MPAGIDDILSTDRDQNEKNNLSGKKDLEVNKVDVKEDEATSRGQTP